MNDKSIMPFGKHKGKALINVPAEYLLWLYGAWKSGGFKGCPSLKLKTYIEENLDVLQSEAEREKRVSV